MDESTGAHNNAQQVVVGGQAQPHVREISPEPGADRRTVSAAVGYGHAKDALLGGPGGEDNSLTPPDSMKFAYEKDCVELFLDGRALAAQASPTYGRGVAQTVISPPDARGKCGGKVSARAQCRG